MTRRFTTAAALTAAFLAAAATGAQALGFDNCKDITLKITNNSDESIQLFDINYYDYGASMWRSEPTTNRVLDPGDTYSPERNLEFVKNADTKIHLKYRTKNANFRWQGTNTESSGRFHCTKGKTVKINID